MLSRLSRLLVSKGSPLVLMLAADGVCSWPALSYRLSSMMTSLLTRSLCLT